MSADKFEVVRESLADVFKEPNLNAVGAETSHTTFNQEALSEAFGESRLNTYSPAHPFARSDHAALTEIFNEALPTSSTERLSPTRFDQAFADILSGRPPQSGHTQSLRPNFAQETRLGMSDKSPPVSTNTRPHQPSFDHQALAEMIAESRADPIEMPRPIYDTDSLSAPFPGGVDHLDPLAKPSTVTPSTTEDSTRSPRARSLLARLHHLFAAKDETPPRIDGETNSSRPLLADQAQKPEPAAIDIPIPVEVALPTNPLLIEYSPTSIEQKPESLHLFDKPCHGVPATAVAAVTASIDVANTLLPQATLWPDDGPYLNSSYTGSSAPKFESKPSIPTDAGRLNGVDSDVKAVGVAASSGVENALPQHASSWSVDTALPKFYNMKPPAPVLRGENLGQTASDQPVFEATESPENSDVEAESTLKFSADLKSTLAASAKEASPLTSPTQLKYLGLVAKTASTVPTDNLANAAVQPWQPERLLDEIFSPASPSTGSHPFIVGDETSPILRSGEPNGLEPAVEPVTTPPPVQAVTEQQTDLPPLGELSSLISTNTIIAGLIHEKDPQPSLPSGRPDNVGPSAESIEITPNNAVGGLPQHVGPLLAALSVLKAKPSPPLLEEKPSRPVLASQSDDARKSEESDVHLSHAESAFAQLPKSLMPELPALASINAKSSAQIFEHGRRPSPAKDQPGNEMPTAQSAAAAPSTDPRSLATRAQQAKLLLDGLDLSTAIQLRWTMRDIRGKRTKFSPVKADDLAALVRLGLVELRDGLPKLTALGVLALDYVSGGDRGGGRGLSRQACGFED